MSTRISSHKITALDQQEKGSKVNPEHYVTQSWMPVSEIVLAQIKEKSERGLYNSSPGSFLSDLRQDIGLFAWFLRKLPDLLYAPSSAIIPTQIIDGVDWNKCMELFQSISIDNFPRKLKGALKVQSSSLKHAVISTTTAEAVASCTEVNPELAHLCAAIRQTGVSLVAWNYPKIFSRAVGNFSEAGGSLDDQLHKFIGYYPSSLAATICLDWDQANKVKTLVSSDFGQRDHSELDSEQMQEEVQMKLRLDNCLELGDAMAYLSDPEHFPKYARNWQSTVDKLKKNMGPDAVEMVQSKLAGFSSTYSTADFNFNINLEPKKNLTQTSIFRVADRLMEGNPWVYR